MEEEPDIQGRVRVENALKQLDKTGMFGLSGDQTSDIISPSRNTWWNDSYGGFFDFEELDEIDDATNDEAQVNSQPSTAPAPPPKNKWDHWPPMNVQVVSGFTGQQLCDVKNAFRAWRVDELKAHIEKAEGTQIRRQQLLFEGQIMKDTQILGDILSGASHAEFGLVRVEPQWANLIDAVAAGEVLLQDLDEAARNDRALVLTAIRATQGRALEHASWTLQNDRGVVLEAVRRNGLTLRHASFLVKRDREVVLAAVREWAQALEFAESEFRTDFQLVMTAIRRDPRAARVLKEELLGDHSFAQDIATDSPRVWEELPDELRASRQFALAVVRGNGEALIYAKEWQTDAEIALFAMHKSPHVLKEICHDLREERKFVVAAIDVNPKVFAYLSMSQRCDEGLALVACKRDTNMVRFVPPDMAPRIWKEIHRDVAEQAGVPEEYMEKPDQPVWWAPGVKPNQIKTK